MLKVSPAILLPVLVIKLMDQRRTARVSEAVREELSEIISFEMNDPRVKGVTDLRGRGHPGRASSAGQCSPISATPNSRRTRWQLSIMPRAHLRHELAGRLQLRHVPELTFVAPDTGSRCREPRRNPARARQEKQAWPGKSF